MVHVWLPYDSREAAIDQVGEIEGVTFDVCTAPDRVPDGAERVEYVALPNQRGAKVWARLRELDLPALRAVQLGSAGYESFAPTVPATVSLCNAGGVHDAATAELAVALVLDNLRGLDTYARQQAEAVWQPHFSTSLADRRVLIFGYGRIGAAVERRIAPFEPARIVRVARRPRTDPDVRPASELAELLPQTDVVVITAPATPDTTGAFDAATLALLPDGALVVNVGRGVVLDTEAALAEAGRLRFALDVTDPEPLPPQHPLWHAEGVTIVPHVGGFTTAFQPRYDALLRRQLTHLAAGEPLENVVAGPGAV